LALPRIKKETSVSASVIYTIGHSNHTLEKLVELLKKNGIELVVDVRSSPFSRYSPQFNKENIEEAFAKSGVLYEFHGNALGGRPNDPSCYDEHEVNYVRIREKEWFQEGIAYLCWRSSQQTLALLCAEEDPHMCHRHNLVAQALLDRGIRVTHIRASGELEEAAKNKEQLRLF
jgi:uncharacterized protein (DUF488 family)